jgi:hypothetical protein
MLLYGQHTYTWLGYIAVTKGIPFEKYRPCKQERYQMADRLV